MSNNFYDISLGLNIFNMPCLCSRLLTLFRMKRRFRDVFGTAVILYPRLVSAMIVLLLTFYFFAIIGMECFHNVVLFDCCKYGVNEIFYLSKGPNDLLIIQHYAETHQWRPTTRMRTVL